MESVLLGVNVLAAIIIIGLVLMQHGKGADAGASFGSGASQTVFGSSGSGGFLSRATTWMTVIFFASSLGLAIEAKKLSGLGVQNGGSLISGNIDEINDELRLEAQSDIPSLSIDTTESIDIPVLDTPAIEMSVDEAPEGAAAIEE